MLVPLVVFMFWLGVGPGLVLDKIGPSLDRVMAPVVALQETPAVHHDSGGHTLVIPDHDDEQTAVAEVTR